MHFLALVIMPECTWEIRLMYENAYLARVICKLLEGNSPVVLASIVKLEGSSPRHNGAKMVIASDDRIYGTIGGSLLEARAIHDAHVAIAIRRSQLLVFDLNGKDANAMGMICGGRTSVLLDYIPPTAANKDFFGEWLKALQSSRDFCFVTHLRSIEKAIRVTGHSFVYGNGEVIADGLIDEEDIRRINSELRGIHVTTIVENEDSSLVIDPIRKVKTVYLLGAGHVAVPTAPHRIFDGFPHDHSGRPPGIRQQ